MCLVRLSARVDAKSHWLHLFDFSPLCIFKCLLKTPTQEEVNSHWLHLWAFLSSFRSILTWSMSIASLNLLWLLPPNWLKKGKFNQTDLAARWRHCALFPNLTTRWQRNTYEDNKEIYLNGDKEIHLMVTWEDIWWWEMKTFDEDKEIH